MSANDHTVDDLALAQELRGFVRKLRQRLREQAGVRDLRPTQVAVIMRLERDGPETTSGLARQEGMRPQSMSTVIAALEAEGLVEGRPDPEDGRKTILDLTERCRTWLAESRSVREDWLMRTVRERLSEDDKVLLGRAMPILKRLSEY